jgi:cation:H+ antiporter
MTLDRSVVAFVVGSAVSLAMSWLLVSRLERVGERFGLSEGLLGILAAFAADTPEITASITALSHHQRTVGAGVVLGSNVFNLAALLGLGALVAGRIGLHRKVVALGGVVGTAVALVCLLAVTGLVGPSVALVLVLVVLASYMVVLSGHRTMLRRVGLPDRSLSWVDAAVREEEVELTEAVNPPPATRRDVLEACGALVVVVAASIAMERGASTLGRRFALSDLVVGGLILAAVTSLPNAVAAVYLAGRGRGAAALSTTLNSNSLNVLVGLLVPGVVVGLAPVSTQGDLVVGWYLGLTVVTLVLAYAGRGLGRVTGGLIVVGYGAFVAAVLAYWR